MDEIPRRLAPLGWRPRDWGALGLILWGIWLLSGCAFNQQMAQLPTLIPEEHLPTVIAQTSEALASQTAAAQPTFTITPSSTLTKTVLPTTVGPSPTASRTSLPTHTPTLTGTATITLTPTHSATPTKTATPTRTNTPTNTPSITPTPTPPLPDEIPFAAVQIINPGALSKVVSPIELYTFVAPGEDGRIRVELTGEDGRLLYRQIFIYTETPAGARVKLNASVNFEIVGVAETARLTVSINDVYERLKALSTVDLVLLAEGQADLYPAGDLLEEIYIQQPMIKSLVQGDSVLVSGLARTADDQPLLVELIATDGRILGSRLAGIAPLQDDGGHRLFAAEVPFSVASPTWVRVTVTDQSGRLPGPRHVSSVEVLLSPP
ncbi:MAG TPA: hypothetical protein DEH22_06245 [Chloroflexi bacterium]|nr:hypothetical protein [Chloroflexota bacterium]